MPLLNYGLLAGRVTGHCFQAGDNPHLLLEIRTAHARFDASINVQATSVGYDPPKLEYQILDLTTSKARGARELTTSVRGFFGKKAKHPNGAFYLTGVDANIPTLDYVRDGVVDMSRFTVLGHNEKGSRNGFGKALIEAASQAAEDTETFVAVWGTGYPDQDDRIAGYSRNPRRASFGFTGIDNVHMNQGTFHRVGHHLTGHFAENGPHQDGAILFYFGDGSVKGFFSKFSMQDSATDAFGNPVSTGVPVLDTIESAIKKRLARKPSPSLMTAFQPPRAPSSDDPTVPLPAGAKQGAPQFVFADTTPADPTRPFTPVWDDSQVRNSPFVNQFAKYGVPEPVPSPRGGDDPVVSLSDVLDARAIQAIKKSGRIVFHAAGDTGAPDAQKLPHETAVADLMTKDFAAAAPDNPVFLFHLGDVVYFYGEDTYFYDQFYKPFEFYPAPIFAIPGNHDAITYKEGMVSLDAFIKAFCDSEPRHPLIAGGISRTSMIQPGVYFTLDAPLVSIIGLYSNCSENYGYLDQQQKLFLYKELVRLKQKRDSGEIAAVVLAVHHPPLSFNPKKPSSAAMRDDIDKACQEAGLWPDAVLSGHAHMYQRMTRTMNVGGQSREIPHIVSGSGGYNDNGGEIDKADMKLQDVSDAEFRLHRYMQAFGYLRLTVQTATRDAPATLRIEFLGPDPQQAPDAVVLNLDTHQLM